MIKLVAIMDKNNIMADQDYHENLKFLEKIMPELNHFATTVKSGDVIIGEHAFWEAVIELNGLEDFAIKDVYIITDKTFDQIQNMHPEVKLAHNIKVVKNLDEIKHIYQGHKKDAFVWGGVRTINKLASASDEIIILRTTQTRTEGLKFNHEILHNFKLSSTNNDNAFQIEIYTKN